MSNVSTYNSAQSRTAGLQDTAYKSVQSWKTPKNIAPKISQQNAQNSIIGNLEKASDGKVGTFDVQLQTAQAYASNNKSIRAESDSFKFRDVVDVINPLHHLPIVGMVYRGVTGDELHPASQIIGGAVYGGPIGAITGTANAITKIQTGKDIGDHTLNLVGLGRPEPLSPTEENLNKVATKIESKSPLEDLPGTALSFVNMAEPHKAPRTYERIQIAEGRTAGTMSVKKNWAQPIKAEQTPPAPNIDILPAQETITSLSLSAMPPRRNT